MQILPSNCRCKHFNALQDNNVTLLNMSEYSRKIFLLSIFSIAMGYMESAIVVYLRALYYPDGFDFPLVPLDNHILVTELLREAATIIMLVIMGALTGRGFAQKFVYFLYCFAIWDIFYYIFLWLLIDWPASLLTWDILFLLPVPWIGPVLAPVILSLTMILLTMLVLNLHSKGYIVRFGALDWSLLITGSLVVIYSFTKDYFAIIGDTSTTDAQTMMDNLRNYIPQSYNWLIFMIGEVLILVDVVLIFLRKNRYK